MKMSKIDQIILNIPTEEREKVLAIRARFPSLMELKRERAQEIAKKALLLNYIAGSGRRLGVHPHYYEVPDGKGGTYIKETYFTHCGKFR